MRLSKRGELKALRAGLKRLQLENLQHIKKKKKHLGPVQPPNFSWAEPNTLNYSYTKSSAFSPSPAGNFASGATLERLWFRRILGDPGAVSRVGRKGATKVFNYGRKSPWVPTLTEIFPRIQADAGSWLGTKNSLYYCAQSANSFFWVPFVSSYTTAIVSITPCLAHAPKKCRQSGNFQFDIKSPSDLKILSARKLKTLFQNYKLELTTGIHACIGHVLCKY